MQNIRFLKDYKNYKKGKCYCVSNNTAASLIQKEIAVLSTTPLPSSTEKKHKMMTPRRGRGYGKPKTRYRTK